MTAHSKNISPHSHDAISEQPEQQVSTIGSYLIREKIGQGSFATVYKAQHKVSGHLVAIKSVSRSKLTKKLLENLESEISILKAIQHDHIVGLSECQQTNTHIYLVMDYCTMGDLSQYINEIRKSTNRKGPLGGLPENTVRHFLHQLASALQFLRSRNLVHRDIKPQNLLLVSPQKTSDPSSSSSISNLPILQVADFGFARFLPNASMADTLCGSPLYMGPEILSYQQYDAKADLWSVGTVLYEMMTGRPPFRAQNHMELLKKIQDTKDVIRFPTSKTMDGQPPWTGDDLKDLTRKLLKKNPVERLDFEKFFTHPAILSSTTTKTTTTTTTTTTTIIGSSHTSTSSTTPPRPISRKHPQDPPTCYEAPPFAQSSSTPYQNPRQTITISSSPTRQNQNRHSRDINDDNLSPLHLHGRSGKTVDFNDLHESRSTTQNGEHEDVIRGYVVLDKRNIAANQFADEMNGIPQNDIDEQHFAPRQSMDQVAIQRRKSSSSLSSVTSSLASNQTGYPPSSTSPNTPPFTATSREKRTSTGSVPFAFTKALTIASERLFGTGHSPTNDNTLQQTMIGSPRGYLQMTGIHTEGFPDNIHHSGDSNNDDDEDNNKTMVMIENAACMGHAVAKFADTKFALLMNGDGGDHSSGGGGGLKSATNNSMLSAEALVLHIKALALLELGLDMAKGYWYRRRTDPQWRRHDRRQQTPSPSATRLNDAVQWMRERFNECLDRASFEKTKCESSVDSSHDSSSSGNNPCVEKLLYDKALEMSRAAAVHELVGENIVKCEQDYRTAIWMLEAILEVGDDKDMVIEEGDRNIINSFIDSIEQRISVLRKKLLNQNEQQYPSNNNNKSGTPPPSDSH